jgi:uncharacterized protein (TIGR00159 family)
MDALPFTVGLRWQSAVDLAVLTLTLYAVLRWAQRARAVRIAFLIVSLHVAAVSTSYFGLGVTAWVLHGASLIALVVLFVLFQPEVRHSVIFLVSAVSKRGGSRPSLAAVHEAISNAAFALAEKHRGALIALAQSGPFSQGVAHGGISLDAKVSAELLEAIFLRDSPLHDGAAVVEGDRIARAGVLLPVASRTDIPSYLGARHRAAVGLAECCDALIVVVSEERGEVRLVCGRQIQPIENATALFNRLQDLEEGTSRRDSPHIRRPALADIRLALAAAVLAGLVWLTRLLQTTSG